MKKMVSRMKSLRGRSKTLAIGRRTNVNVLSGKTVRKGKDGVDFFDDYWTASSNEDSNLSDGDLRDAYKDSNSLKLPQNNAVYDRVAGVNSQYSERSSQLTESDDDSSDDEGILLVRTADGKVTPQHSKKSLRLPKNANYLESPRRTKHKTVEMVSSPSRYKQGSFSATRDTSTSRSVPSEEHVHKVQPSLHVSKIASAKKTSGKKSVSINFVQLPTAENTPNTLVEKKSDGFLSNHRQKRQSLVSVNNTPDSGKVNSISYTTSADGHHLNVVVDQQKNVRSKKLNKRQENVTSLQSRDFENSLSEPHQSSESVKLDNINKSINDPLKKKKSVGRTLQSSTPNGNQNILIKRFDKNEEVISYVDGPTSPGRNKRNSKRKLFSSEDLELSNISHKKKKGKTLTSSTVSIQPVDLKESEVVEPVISSNKNQKKKARNRLNNCSRVNSKSNDTISSSNNNDSNVNGILESQTSTGNQQKLLVSSKSKKDKIIRNIPTRKNLKNIVPSDRYEILEMQSSSCNRSTSPISPKRLSLRKKSNTITNNPNQHNEKKVSTDEDEFPETSAMPKSSERASAINHKNKNKNTSNESNVTEQSTVMPQANEIEIPQFQSGTLNMPLPEKLSKAKRKKRNEMKQNASNLPERDEGTSVTCTEKDAVGIQADAHHSKNKNSISTKKNKNTSEKISAENYVISSESCARRSSRLKLKPLDFWRCERTKYKYMPDGNIDFVSIEKGSSINNFAVPLTKSKTAAGKAKKVKQNKTNALKIAKIKSAKDNETDIMQKKVVALEDDDTVEVLDIETKEAKIVDAVRRFKNLVWRGPENISYDNRNKYSITRCFSSETSSVGFLQLEGRQEKKLQYLPDDNVVFIVNEGAVHVQIYHTTFCVSKNDSFIVPRANSYSITNLQDNAALLSFFTSRLEIHECNEDF